MHAVRSMAVALLVLALAARAQAQDDFEPNYDEDKVPNFTLPDPLVLSDATKVADAQTWRTKRRPEILQLFTEQVYGRSPPRVDVVPFEVAAVDDDALGGKAIRKEVNVWFTGDKTGAPMSVLTVS